MKNQFTTGFNSILFLLSINDIPSLVNSNVILFVDETKIWRTINNKDDILILQQDLKMMMSGAKNGNNF